MIPKHRLQQTPTVIVLLSFSTSNSLSPIAQDHNKELPVPVLVAERTHIRTGYGSRGSLMSRAFFWLLYTCFRGWLDNLCFRCALLEFRIPTQISCYKSQITGHCYMPSTIVLEEHLYWREMWWNDVKCTSYSRLVFHYVCNAGDNYIMVVTVPCFW
jgi:hypothetical protein